MRKNQRIKNLELQNQALRDELELAISPEDQPEFTESLAYWQNAAFAHKEEAGFYYDALIRMHDLFIKTMDDLISGLNIQ